MKDLRDLTFEELTSEIAALGEKPYRARQIYEWLFTKGVTSIDEMGNVPKTLRDGLKKHFIVHTPFVTDIQNSEDGTIKFALEFKGRSSVESVIIPEQKRTTLCVSTQVGCKLGCRFCATGAGGFRRNLTCSEMVGQLLCAQRLPDNNRRITNVVLMGMGEPLLNYDNVVRFIKVLTDPKGLGFAPRRVTLSTAGVVPGIKRLGRDAKVNLAVSLNATTDEVRDKLMPINKKYPLRELIAALKEYCHGKKIRVTIEYILIKNVNDSSSDARRLGTLLRGIRTKINLIALNPCAHSGLSAPAQHRITAFHKILSDTGHNVIIRSSKGVDIQAACGQLAGGGVIDPSLLPSS